MFSSQYFLQMPVMFSDKLEDFLLSYADCLVFFSKEQKKIGLILSYGHQCLLMPCLVNMVYALLCCLMLFILYITNICHSVSQKLFIILDYCFALDLNPVGSSCTSGFFNLFI